MLGGLGIGGIVLLVILALLLFGPNKLPELGRAVGRTLKEFKAGANEVMEAGNQSQKVESAQAEVIEVSERNNKRLPE